MSCKSLWRGTTPILNFTLPFETSIIDQVWITFSQSNTVVLNKVKSDVTMSGKTITLQMTQANTLLFDSSKYVEIQLRILTSDGKAYDSKIIKESVGRILKDGVISE